MVVEFSLLYDMQLPSLEKSDASRDFGDGLQDHVRRESTVRLHRKGSCGECLKKDKKETRSLVSYSSTNSPRRYRLFMTSAACLSLYEVYALFNTFSLLQIHECFRLSPKGDLE